MRNFIKWKSYILLFFFGFFLLGFQVNNSLAVQFQPEDVKALWNFEDNLLDDSINNRDLFINGNLLFSSTTVITLATSTLLDGNSCPEVNSDLDITTGPASFSLWVNLTHAPTVPQAEMFQILRKDSTAFVAYHIVIDNNSIEFKRTRDGIAEDIITEIVTLDLNTPYHLVLTYDGTNIEAWRNGVSKGTASSTGVGIATNGDKTFIGSSNANCELGHVRQTNGKIDQVLVLNRKLTNAEIASLYNNGLGDTINEEVAVPSPSFNFLWPQNSTTTPDFRNWTISFNANTTSTKFYSIVIVYG